MTAPVCGVHCSNWRRASAKSMNSEGESVCSERGPLPYLRRRCLATYDDGYTVVDGRCVAFAHPITDTTPEGIVTRCADGFFLKDGACRGCVGCATCFNATTCLSCGKEEILSGTTCESGTEMSQKCKKLIEGNGGCALCLDGFYREGTTCVVCPDNRKSCAKGGCRVCDASFWLNTTSLLCESFDTLSITRHRRQQGASCAMLGS